MIKPSVLLLSTVLAGCAVPMTEGVLGTAPTYLDTSSRDVPNVGALGHRIWTPRSTRASCRRALRAAVPSST